MSISKVAILGLVLRAAGLHAQSPTTIENSTVKVINAIVRPHQKTTLHKHDFNRVMVYLSPGDLDITTEDGRVDHQHWKANDVAWSPIGPTHVSENVGSRDLQLIEVEIKTPPPEVAPKRDPKYDPIVIDPARNKLVFENSQVRVFRSSLESGAREKWHEHMGRGRAIVLLTPVAARIEPARGQQSPLNGSPGDVFWTDGPSRHRASNIGSRSSEIVVIEVK